MVELRDASYRVGAVQILDTVSVRFEPGRFNVVLGPNGAGKSTLLRLATGLARPTAGAVLYDGRGVDTFAMDELARVRAVLSQNVELAFALPVVDVVMMGRYPHYRRAPSTRDREIVEEALDVVGMREKRLQAYPTLSGGERQKVQMARVLSQIWADDTPGAPAAAPHRYLFLDEPTNSLDVHYQLHLLDVARGLVSHDCTVVAILHDLNTAFEYGDHFVLLERGRVALESHRASEIPAGALERIFRVTAHPIVDPTDNSVFWRFGL